MRILSIIFFLLLISSCSNQGEDSKFNNGNSSQTTSELKNTYDTIINTIDGKVIIQYFHNDILTTKKTFYSSGILQEELEYNDDSYGFKYKMFHQNGKLKTTGEQGGVASCGIQVGTWMNYDTSEFLIQKKVFEHFLPEEAYGCHETSTVISITDYYSNGNVKKNSQIETCYECDECPCGKWESYDKEGNLIESKDYENCYNFRLECSNY